MVKVRDREIGSCLFVQVQAFVLPDKCLLAKGWHDELEQRQRVVPKEIGLFNSDSFELCVLFDAAESLFHRHVSARNLA